MLVKTGTPNQMAYLDKCIRSALAYISNLDVVSTSKLLSITKQYYADTLSQISIFTKIARIALDNYSSINIELLSSILDNEKKTFIKNSFKPDSLATMQSIIQLYTNNVTSSQNELINIYGLKSGDLSVFNYDDIESGISFKIVEDTSPLVFKYYEGKITLKNTTDLLKNFTMMKDIYEKNCKSLSILSTDKACDVLVYFSNTLKALNATLTEFEYLLDSLYIADSTYNKFLLSNDKYYNSFLSRNYDTIKIDIINSYFS